MNSLKLPLLCVLIVANFFLTAPVAGQQKRRNPDKPPAKAPAPAPAPAPTFDTLLAADTFKIYGEVRNVGALVRSSALNDVLEPVLKLGGPPKDFVEFVNWMKSHSDQLTTSRMLVAIAPTVKDLPEFVVAIEFSSPEEAAKFETPLNGMLPVVLPPVTPQSSPAPDQKTVLRPPAAGQKPPAPVPGYSLQRHGSLLLVSPAPVELKKLRPAGSKPLSEDPNFRVGYDRFVSDPVFVFVDMKAMEKEEQERQKQWAEEREKADAARKAEEEKQKAEGQQDPENAGEMEPPEDEKVTTVGPPELAPETAREPTQDQIVSAALSAMAASMISGQPVSPDALGIGFSPENESFDVRMLMIDAPGKTSDPFPIRFFMPGIKFGPPIAPQSPAVIPNDSDLVLTMSLDFQQLYARISAPPEMMFLADPRKANAIDPQAPLAGLEKVLKIKIKDDLVPLLGSEVAVSLPLAEYNPLAPPSPPAPKEEAKDAEAKGAKETPRAAFAVISLRDKEGMQRLMPKLLESLAGKAAAALAQTERREDTELVSYAGMFGYAFVGNFLVLSNDPATVRHVVDSYLKGATLAADVPFRNYTRWQPHELQGQIYVSPAFTESYKVWANSPNARITDEARAFFARLPAAAQPITYSLSNDGFGTLHELHVPKSVLLLSVAGIASTANPPPMVTKEREAIGTLWTIANAERQYKEKNKSGYASLEELMTAELLPKEMLNSKSYKFEIEITADGYAITAVPVEYGKSGKMSYFMDQTGVIRGADHGGNSASASDPPVGY